MLLRSCLVLVGGLLAGGSAASQTNWSGSYVGVYGGHTAAKSHLSTTTEFAPSGIVPAPANYFQPTSVGVVAAAGRGVLSSARGVAGLTWGRNWQSGSLVSGLEVDLGSLSLQAVRAAGAVYPCCAPSSFEVRQSIETDGLVTLRGRIGQMFERSLMYATAGMAWTRVGVQAQFSDNVPDARASTTLSKLQRGWALGLGYERRFEGAWSAKVEVLHLDFGRVSSNSNNMTHISGPFPGNVFTTSARLRASQIRVGLNKRW